MILFSHIKESNYPTDMEVSFEKKTNYFKTGGLVVHRKEPFHTRS